MIVVVIETGLTDADYLGMRRGIQQRRGVEIGVRVSFVRMDADAGPDVILGRGSADHLVPFPPAGGNVEKTADSRLASAGDDALLVLDQALVFEEAVGI